MRTHVPAFVVLAAIAPVCALCGCGGGLSVAVQKTDGAPKQSGPNVRPIIKGERKIYSAEPVRLDGLELRLNTVNLGKSISLGRSSTYDEDWRVTFHLSVSDPGDSVTYSVDPRAQITLLTDERDQPLPLNRADNYRQRPEVQWRLSRALRHRDQGGDQPSQCVDEFRTSTLPNFFARAEGSVAVRIVDEHAVVELALEAAEAWTEVGDGVRARVSRVNNRPEERRSEVLIQVETPSTSDPVSAAAPFVLAIEVVGARRSGHQPLDVEDTALEGERSITTYGTQVYTNDGDLPRRIRITVATRVRAVDIPFCFTNLPGSRE